MNQIGSLLKSLPAEQRTCESHGDYLAKSIAGRWTRCPECVNGQRAAEDVQRIRDAQLQRLEARMNASGVPPRFADCTLDSYVVTNEGQRRSLDFSLELASALAEKTEGGRSAVFCGLPGTGKTHLACSLVKATIQADRTALFTTAIRLVRRIKETWSKTSSESESEVIDDFVRPSLLVIDEIGVQFGSDTEKMLLFDVLNERYEQRKSVVLVSNLSIDGVKDFLGERVFDRLREDGGVYIPFNWESFRGAA
ncbi:MAG: ATP-binding protein [Bradyrhizobium sp.]|nr:ATP-binding protein [Bradyrhizobium sp.]